MIHVLCGSEDYLISKRKHELSQLVTVPDLNLSRCDEFTSETLELLQTYPVMEDCRVVIMDCDNLSQLNNSVFLSYLEHPVNTSVLVIHVRAADWRTKFAQKIENTGYVERYNKLTNLSTFKKLILDELKSANAAMSEDALNEFISRENYLDNDDVTLFQVINDLQALITVNKSISIEMVKRYVKRNDTGDGFALAKLILSGDVRELRRQASLLPADEAIPKLGILLREYRIAYKLKYFPQNEIGAKYIALRSLSKEKLLAGIKTCTEMINMVKTGQIESSIALQTTLEILLKNS